MAQDCMAAIAIMGLSLIISAPRHVAGNSLDLLFISEQVEHDLDVDELKITQLTWSDNFLGFRSPSQLELLQTQ